MWKRRMILAVALCHAMMFGLSVMANPATQPASSSADAKDEAGATEKAGRKATPKVRVTPTAQDRSRQNRDSAGSSKRRTVRMRVGGVDRDGTRLAQNSERSERGPRVSVTAPGERRSDRGAEEPSEPVDVVDVIDDSTQEVANIGNLSGLGLRIEALDDGSLIVYGTEQDVAIIEAFIEQMDKTSDVDKDFVVIPLKNAQAKTLAPQIEQIWNDSHRRGGRRRQVSPEDEITIIAEPRSNVLLVASAKVNIPKIRSIIDQLDELTVLDKDKVIFEPFTLDHINADEAKIILDKMLESVKEQRGATDLQITIEANPRQNQLLINAPEGEMDQIRHLISLIDVEPDPQGRNVVKLAVYPLLEAKADDLSDLLSEMLQVDIDADDAVDEKVRMLQVLMQSVGGETDAIVALNLEKPIQIFPDRGGNALVVATVEENIKPIGEIIRQLDTHAVGAEMQVDMYTLAHADAETVANQIRDMFDQGGRLAEQPGLEVSSRTPSGQVGEALAYNIGIVADKRSNTILVAGRPEQLTIVQRILETVDTEEDASKFAPRILTLEHADVETIQQTLQQVADQWREAADQLGGGIAAQRERVEIIPDVRTNSLIIVAREDNYDRIAELATKLDGADADYMGQVRIIDLENLAASDIADKIEQLWERKLEQRRRSGLPEDKPVLVSDTRSNALIIAANNDDFAAIERIIQQLEQQPNRPMQDIRQINIEHHGAATLAEVIQSLFDQRIQQSLDEGESELPSDRVFLDADPMSNTILVVSSKTNYDEIVRLVNLLDKPPAVEGIIRTFTIRNADVTKVKDILDEMFDAGVYMPGGDREIPEEETRVNIVTDVRSSSLLVSASPTNLKIIEELIKDLDRTDPGIVIADARFLPIEHADPIAVGDMLTQLFEGMRSALDGDQQDQLELTVVPDPQNRRIAISGTRYAMKRAEELLPRLDQHTDGPASDVRVYQLVNANAAKLSEVLRTLFDESENEDIKRAPITILPEEGSNSLIVIASEPDHALVKRWTKDLDIASTRSSQMRVFPLKVAKAEQVSDILSDLLDSQSTEIEETFSVVPDPRTESIIVFGSPDLLRNVAEIVKNLDNNESINTMEMRVFRLFNQKAEDLAERLDEFFEQAGSESGADARQLIVQFTAMDYQTGQEVLRKLVHQDITITPEPVTNSLLVLAPAGQIEMMEQLIVMLDSVPLVETRAEVFVLRNANATDMADLLEELFAAERGEEGAPRISFGDGGPMLVGGSGDSAVEVAFGVDPRTNSLIVAGSESILASVRKLITELDYMEVQNRRVEVVRLNYARATEVAETLTDFYDEQLERIQEASEDALSAQRLEELRVTARDFTEGQGEGDDESSVLLVSYSPRMEAEVINLINELDQPPPQVMIQVLMAEVTLDDRFEMGMEFALQDLLFSEQATVGPNGIIQGPDKDFIGGTSVGASGESALGGFTFTITGEDFNFLLRALEAEGRLEVLSRPAIMVEHGREATIIVGERVPTVQDFRTDNSGATIPSVTYEEVGIQLVVTPIINPDGYVSMHIEPEISAIGNSSVAVAAGVNLPIFTTREAETDVTVKNGETVIIGGLITSQTNRSENKVPVAGDVPIIGNLFRAKVNTQTKTELLMILTPNVIRTPEDAYKHSVKMRDQTGLIDNIRRSPLMQKLQVKPTDELIRPINSEELRPNIDPGDRYEGTTSEPLGPELDVMGPEASIIRTGAKKKESLVSYPRR